MPGTGKTASVHQIVRELFAQQSADVSLGLNPCDMLLTVID